MRPLPWRFSTPMPPWVLFMPWPWIFGRKSGETAGNVGCLWMILVPICAHLFEIKSATFPRPCTGTDQVERDLRCGHVQEKNAQDPTLLDWLRVMALEIGTIRAFSTYRPDYEFLPPDLISCFCCTKFISFPELCMLRQERASFMQRKCKKHH